MQCTLVSLHAYIEIRGHTFTMSTKYCYNTWERQMCIGFSDRVWRLILEKTRSRKLLYAWADKSIVINFHEWAIIPRDILSIRTSIGGSLPKQGHTWPWVRVGDPPTIWECTLLPGHNWEVWDPQSREKSASLQSLLALKGVPGGMTGLACQGPDKT